MARALERHDELVATVVAAHRGQLIKSKGEGDSSLSAFSRASDAAGAALDLRAATEAERWPQPITLRVRMAVHTGEVHEMRVTGSTPHGAGFDYSFYGVTTVRAGLLARCEYFADGDLAAAVECFDGLVRQERDPAAADPPT